MPMVRPYVCTHTVLLFMLITMSDMLAVHALYQYVVHTALSKCPGLQGVPFGHNILEKEC